jgi:hypothetical protein
MHQEHKHQNASITITSTIPNEQDMFVKHVCPLTAAN